MWQGYLEMWETVWWVWRNCLEGMAGSLEGVGEVICFMWGQGVQRVWDGCLDSVGRLSGGVGRLYRGCRRMFAL